MEEIMKHIISEVIPVLGALLTALATYGVSLLTKRFKIQLSEEHKVLTRIAVRKAISGAEEWAYRKGKIEDRSVNGGEKATWVHNRVKKAFPNLASDELDLLIDEELGSIKGVGSSGEQGLDV
jgi:hypothetical protein